MAKRKASIKKHTNSDIALVRTLVRARQDYQDMRVIMDNRLGVKANGDKQNVDRDWIPEDESVIQELSATTRDSEDYIEKELKRILKRFPIWTEYLADVKGVGPVIGGWIVSSINIETATTVSKIWQYCGLNSGNVRGKKICAAKDYRDDLGQKIKEFSNQKGDLVIYQTDTEIRGDRMTPGFLSPYNKNIRRVLIGILAPSFLKCSSPYRKEFYDDYKYRLENSDREVLHRGKMTPWKDTSAGHRDMAARRKMIKQFLLDLYVAWRTLEGLPVREPYAEEYLGKKHE